MALGVPSRRWWRKALRLEVLFLVLAIPWLVITSLWSLHMLPADLDSLSQYHHGEPFLPSLGGDQKQPNRQRSSNGGGSNVMPGFQNRDNSFLLVDEPFAKRKLLPDEPAGGDDHYSNLKPKDMTNNKAPPMAMTSADSSSAFREFSHQFWWKQDQLEEPPMISKVRHSEFLQNIHQAKLELEAAVLDTAATQLEVAHWKPAPAPINQTIDFQPFALPPPEVSIIPESKEYASIAVLVLSAHGNFDRRQAIRETWGRLVRKKGDGTTKNEPARWHLYFVIGHTDCHQKAAANSIVEVAVDENHPCIQKDHNLLVQEQLKYKDLLEIPMAESYRGLPEKVLQAYRWALEFLPESVDWMVKADDDAFVRPSVVAHYLRKYNPRIPLWIGKIIPHSKVRRDGKWAETEYTESEYYPYWAIGSAGHILSRAAVSYLVQESANLHRYQGEDVSIGIWLHQALRKGDLADMTYIQAAAMITNEGLNACGMDDYLIIGHELTVEEIYECSLRFEGRIIGFDHLEQENVWLDGPANLPAVIAQEESATGERGDSAKGGDALPYYLQNPVPQGKSYGKRYPSSLRGHLDKGANK